MLNRDEIDPQGAIIRQTAEAGTAISDELSGLNPNIEIDAKEFGEHVRNGGWRLGLLVARSVAAGTGQGSRTNLAEFSAKFPKISTRAFARQAGGSITDKTVSKYLNAWNMAAADEIVPASSELSPGQSFSFDAEEHTPKVWDSYFKPPTGDEKDPFVTQINKINSAVAIDTSVFTAEAFSAQQEHSVDDVYAAGVNMIRIGQEIQDRCLSAAKQLNHRLSTDGE